MVLGHYRKPCEERSASYALPMNSRSSSQGVGEPGTGAEVIRLLSPHELPRQFTGRRGAGHRRGGYFL